MTAPPIPSGVITKAATLIATGFGIGRLPFAPGTWGSLAALPLAWVIAWLFDWRGLVVAATLLFLIGWWAAALASRASGIEDDGAIVVDEVVGQWLTLVVAPTNIAAYLMGFVLFRIFDIAKPWPLQRVDEHVRGGLGVMADDIVAGVYAAITLLLILWILWLLGKPLG
jgi:phosphatidylglycerophosphatase A